MLTYTCSTVFVDMWREHVISTQTLRREHVSALSFEVFHEFREVYGCRHITRELNKGGIACSVGFIASVMKELGLVSAWTRAYKVTTVRGEEDIYPTDLIARDFTSSLPGMRLVVRQVLAHAGLTARSHGVPVTPRDGHSELNEILKPHVPPLLPNGRT